MKNILLICVVAITVFACDKNKKAIRNIDGDWEVVNVIFIEEDGTVEKGELEEGSTQVFTFENCKMEDDEFCTMTNSVTYEDGSGAAVSANYRVTNNGTQLEIKNNNNSNQIEKAEITRLNNRDLNFAVKFFNSELHFICEKQ